MKLIVCNKDKSISELIESEDIIELMKLLDFHTERLERNGFMLVNEVIRGKQVIREFASKKDGWECAYGIVDKVVTKMKI